jgi:hypothetical protein
MYDKVWRYLELEKTFDPPDFLSRLRLASDLVFQPIGHILFWVCFFSFPRILTYFRYKENPSKFTLLMYCVSSLHIFVGCLLSWSKMLEFYHLGTLFLVQHIKYARARPYFVINSSQKSHQLFKYAAYDSLSSGTLHHIR